MSASYPLTDIRYRRPEPASEEPLPALRLVEPTGMLSWDLGDAVERVRLLADAAARTVVVHTRVGPHDGGVRLSRAVDDLLAALEPFLVGAPR